MQIVKKADFSPQEQAQLPLFPAVEIDGKLIFEGRDLSIEELESKIGQTH